MTFSSHHRHNTIVCPPVRRARLTHTGPAGGQLEAWRALAAVAARNVDAVSVALAQVVPTVTFVNIYTGGREKKSGHPSQGP